LEHIDEAECAAYMKRGRNQIVSASFLRREEKYELFINPVFYLANSMPLT
jgi:hypothetical protein